MTVPLLQMERVKEAKAKERRRPAHSSSELPTQISEVTTTEIMCHLGFVNSNNNAELEAVQSIWRHL